MPYWNEIPGFGTPRPLNRSRRRGVKHGVLAGFALGVALSAYQGVKSNSDSPLMLLLNTIAGAFIFGPILGLYLFSPFLGWFYQWRLIRYRKKNGIPHPSPHSYGGDKWLELDDDDPLRAEVDASLRAQRQGGRLLDTNEH
jgi:hypothetical protein